MEPPTNKDVDEGLLAHITSKGHIAEGFDVRPDCRYRR